MELGYRPTLEEVSSMAYEVKYCWEERDALQSENNRLREMLKGFSIEGQK